MRAAEPPWPRRAETRGLSSGRRGLAPARFGGLRPGLRPGCGPAINAGRGTAQSRVATGRSPLSHRMRPRPASGRSNSSAGLEMTSPTRLSAAFRRSVSTGGSDFSVRRDPGFWSDPSTRDGGRRHRQLPHGADGRPRRNGRRAEMAGRRRRAPERDGHRHGRLRAAISRAFQLSSPTACMRVGQRFPWHPTSGLCANKSLECHRGYAKGPHATAAGSWSP